MVWCSASLAENTSWEPARSILAGFRASLALGGGHVGPDPQIGAQSRCRTSLLGHLVTAYRIPSRRVSDGRVALSKTLGW